MKRKVSLHGPSTLTVSLPSSWAKKYGIKKGDEVEVEETDNGLSVKSNNRRLMGKTEFDISGIDRTFLRCYIRSAYRKGYDEILVEYGQPTVYYYRLNKRVAVAKAAHEEVNQLVGMEIVEQNDNIITIKDLGGEVKGEFDNTLKRIFLLINNFSQDLAKSIELKSSVLDSIEEKHDTIEKFINYCLRLLNKQGVSKNAALLYHIIASLDLVADLIKYTGRDIQKYNGKFDRITVTLLKKTASFPEKYHLLFYNFKNSLVVNFSLERRRLREDIKQAAKRIPAQEAVILNQLEQIVEVLYLLMETRMGLEHR